MRILVLTLVLGCAAQPKPWKWYDVVGETVVVGVLAGDYVQTVKITENGTEGNPVIGQHGERVHPNIYFPVILLIHATVAWFLPQPARGSWQFLTAAIASVSVWNNTMEGFSPFKWRHE